jgi:hypothetical protein
MSKNLFRVGDLVTYITGVDVHIYGSVQNIIDFEGEFYNEYEVITGRGDLNSKVGIVVKPLAYVKDLSYCDLDIFTLDPHKVFKRDINVMREEIKKKMDFLEKKLQFVNKNENRIDKLNKILDPKPFFFINKVS